MAGGEVGDRGVLEHRLVDVQMARPEREVDAVGSLRGVASAFTRSLVFRSAVCWGVSAKLRLAGVVLEDVGEECADWGLARLSSQV